MKIVVATLFCERKMHMLRKNMESLLALEKPSGSKVIYCLNYEYFRSSTLADWHEYVYEFSKAGKLYQFDSWCWNSNWLPDATFDQDNPARLPRIIMARNMCIEYALEVKADKLMFIDADIIAPPDTLVKLSKHPYPMVGGLVGGRNAHKGNEYVFGENVYRHENGLIECDSGNVGFQMIDRSVFEYVRFRRGSHANVPGLLQSDDPNFNADAKYKWDSGQFYIDSTVVGEHVDDEVLPFGDGAKYPV